MTNVVLRKIFNIPIINKAGYEFNGVIITEDAFKNGVEEYVNSNAPLTLSIYGRNTLQYMKGEIRKIEKDNIVFACDDKDTILFLNKYEEASVCILFDHPNVTDYENANGITKLNKIKIMRFVYLPCKPDERK